MSQFNKKPSGGGGGSAPNAVQATNSTVGFFTTSSGVFVDTGFGVTITPSSSSAKIRLSLVLQEAHVLSANDYVTIFRGIGGTNLGDAVTGLIAQFATGSNGASLGAEFLDSPATTSPVTYEVYVRTDGGTFRMNQTGGTSVLIAQEVH